MREFQTYRQGNGRDPDFYVRYKLIPEHEGGRKTPPYQHVRWDWSFADDPTESLAMIWPEFYSSDGEVYPPDRPIPEVGVASMWIRVEDRRKAHMKKVATGVRGYCREGSKRVASCVIIDSFL